MTESQQKPAEQSPCEQAAGQDLSLRVGTRVRRVRQMRGLSRRVLSEMSGVSPRYLAQIEAGTGNISIGLLQRVADALDFQVEKLVGTDDPWDSDAVQVGDMFRAASDEIKAAVMRVLGAQPATGPHAARIALIGLRGAGKSTLGAMLAAELDLPCVELTRVIEENAGVPLSEILAFYGQDGYRRLEASALEQVIARHDRLVLAVAGGIVADPMTYDMLLSRFHTVWLRASPQEHMDRVRAQGDVRAMSGNPEALEQLKSILDSREALYGRAMAQLDTSGQTSENSLKQLKELIEIRAFLAAK